MLLGELTNWEEYGHLFQPRPQGSFKKYPWHLMILRDIFDLIRQM